ncbi:MAG TPA: hypothetical protein VJ739_00950, partial [Gemmataceae bacterium]|nr:hypothetical protein [Gemmataceae bacterium]
DLTAIDLAIADADAETERPTIVIMHSHIGIGTPIHDDHRAHGAPVAPAYAAIARELLHWPHPPFEVPEEVYRAWRSQVAEPARRVGKGRRPYPHFGITAQAAADAARALVNPER